MGTSSVLSAFDYVIFTLSLVVCGLVGVYYVLVERMRRSGVETSSILSTFIRFFCRRKPDEHQVSAADNSMRRNESSVTVTTTEYFLGNRQLAFIPTILSLFASYISAIGLLGLPADIYKYGSVSVFATLSFIPASFINSFIFIPIYYRNNFSCIFEYIEKRFESTLLRKITTTLSALSSIAYAAVCAYIPCVAFEQATGVPEWILIIATGLLTIFYTAVGGLRAVVIVDTIQAGIMFAGIIAVLIAGIVQVGNLDLAWQVASERGRIAIYDWSLGLTASHSFWSLAVGSTVYFAAATNNQALLQRSCSLGSLSKAKLSFILAGPVVALLVLILWLTTIIAFTYFTEIIDCDPMSSKYIKSFNQLISYYVTIVMNYPGFLGLYYACLFSGSLSSMSTCYNTVSSLIWEDWLKEWLEAKLTRRQIALVVKLLATLTGVLTSILALACKYVGGSALKMVISFVSAFSGTIFSAFIAAAFLPFITGTAMIVGLLTGTPFALWVILSQIVYKLGEYPALPAYGRNCALTSSVALTAGNASFVAAGYHQQSAAFNDAAANLSPGLRSLFSLSYNYFVIFCIIVCLGVAIVFSIVSRLIGKYFLPDVDWLQVPREVNPNYLAIRWLASPKCPNSKPSENAGDDVTSANTHNAKRDGKRRASNVRRCTFETGVAGEAHPGNSNRNAAAYTNPVFFYTNCKFPSSDSFNLSELSLVSSPTYTSSNVTTSAKESSIATNPSSNISNNNRFRNVGGHTLAIAGIKNQTLVVSNLPGMVTTFDESAGRLTTYV